MDLTNRKIEITYQETFDINDLEPAERRMLKKAKLAAREAYAPYSEFKVGAAVLLENGEIIIGSNQENAVFPSGCCAERVALFQASAIFPNIPVKSIIIVALHKGKFLAQPVAPCGTCRQVILETRNRFNQAIKVIMFGEEMIRIVNDGIYLLPFPFEKFSDNRLE
jgi:cytidine deaminase